MARWEQDRTVGDVASLYAERLGGTADNYARRLRHLAQNKAITPRKSGEGTYARALFNEEDVLFTLLILTLADAGVGMDALAAASGCRDNLADEPTGEEHDAGFAFVVAGVERGEDWFLNLHLSRAGQHGASFARQPEPAPMLLDSFATVTIPCKPILQPLLGELDESPAPPRMPGA